MWKTKTTILSLIISAAIMAEPSSSAGSDAFVYGGCSQLKFSIESAYGSNLTSLLSSLAGSAGLSRYANFTAHGVCGLCQCRGDLDAGTCSACVSRAVERIGAICPDACGGVVQLEGCLVRYDNVSFVGVEEKTLVLKKCGEPIGPDDREALTRRDNAMSYVGSTGGPYRRVGVTAGEAQAMAQCVGDLSPSDCQDCVEEAVARLVSDCPLSTWADVYLSKCYVRYYSSGGVPSHSEKKQEHKGDQKTIGIIIGIVILIILLVVFLSFTGKQCRKLQGKPKSKGSSCDHHCDLHD
ncbi:PREDICTED: cysteine-rich repeat secretory protein 12-like [Tarenaya hassleriana]|uniref:cysteine-rich repeat secretory protein 12-like n=1 Tax=Tarenaya hassleriana TaxID=28532 RepID=UPI00053C42F8|nr:PREDICTED: cysteine-rich repeat secretory protein 12-like [Tarenaya hassleriana]XP_010533315.1 PREDICTED: cysteine-rich repeat secretory protein 12-like [Tarenaya hassleriana]